MVGWFRRSVIVLLTAVSMAGCMNSGLLYTTIDTDTPPPVGWPALKIQSHYVSPKEMRDVCEGGLGTAACAFPRLKEGVCDVYYQKDYPNAEVTWHEEMHCKGYDHPRGTEIKELMEEYNKWKGADAMETCTQNYTEFTDAHGKKDVIYHCPPLVVLPDIGWYFGKPGE